MRTRAWPDTQAERGIFSSAISQRVTRQLSIESPRPPALTVWSSPPCPEELGVVESAVNRMPIAETGNPFRLRIRFPYVLAQTEAGRVLRDHFQVSLISIWARPMSLTKSRRVQELSGSNIASTSVSVDMLAAHRRHLNENAQGLPEHLDRKIFAAMMHLSRN